MSITKTTSNAKKYMNSKLNYSKNSFVTHDNSKITDEDSTATIMHSRDGKDKCSDQKITRVLDFFNLILYIRNYRITCLQCPHYENYLHLKAEKSRGKGNFQKRSLHLGSLRPSVRLRKLGPFR